MVSDNLFQQNIPRSQILANFLARQQPAPRGRIDATGQALSQIAQALALKKGLDKRDARQEALASTLQQAASPTQVTPSTPGQFGPVQPRPTTQQDIMQALSSNPDTEIGRAHV